MEEQLKAQKSLIELQIDSARRDLELGIRSIRQQDHSDLFQQADARSRETEKPSKRCKMAGF